MKTIYLDAYGLITTKDKALYTCTLNGSYQYCEFSKGYWHGVHSCPPLNFPEYFSKELLVDK